MPGQTDNTDLLAAVNQVIVALNEISAELANLTNINTNLTALNSTLSPASNLTQLANLIQLQGLTNSLNAISTTVEARSLAEVTAQNTNFTNLIAAINALELIANMTCAPNTYISGSTICVPSWHPPLVDPNPAIPPIAQTPPLGFNTWQDYLDYKCKVANWIFDSTSEFFSQIGNIPSTLAGTGIAASETAIAAYLYTIFNGWIAAAIAAADIGAPLTGVLGVGALLATLPEWAIAAIAGAIAVLVITATGWAVTTYFGTIASQMENSRTDTICALYNAGDVSEAQTIINDLLGPIVTQVATTLPPPYNVIAWLFSRSLTQIISYLTMNGSINKLFEKDDSLLTYTGTNPVDCAGCWEGVTWTIAQGYAGLSITQVDAHIWELVPSEIYGGYAIGCYHLHPTNRVMTIELASGSLTTHPNQSYRPIFKLVIADYPDNPSTVYSGDIIPVNPCGNFIECNSGTPFVLRVTLGEEC